jgi:hypothetical protein
MDDSKALIAAVGVAYFYIALRQYFKGDPWVGVMFLGYALGQVGIWFQAK